MALKDIRPALVAFLYADPAIYALVGGDGAKETGGRRIYLGKIDQGVKAASIVYNEISGSTNITQDGPSGLAEARIQIATWAEDPDAAHALMLLVKERLNGYRGVMGSGGAAVNVQGVFMDVVRDQDDDAAGLRGKVMDYLFHYEEL